MDITNYTNDLEKAYYFTRNKNRFLCGCNRMIIKECSQAHFKTQYHIQNNRDFFTTTQVSPSGILN